VTHGVGDERGQYVPVRPLFRLEEVDVQKHYRNLFQPFRTVRSSQKSSCFRPRYIKIEDKGVLMKTWGPVRPPRVEEAQFKLHVDSSQ
jgi:hypothetical protein